MMKYYKNEDGKVYAFETDGSQDKLIKAQHKKLSQSEVSAHLAKKVSVKKTEIPSLETQLFAIWEALGAIKDSGQDLPQNVVKVMAEMTTAKEKKLK